MNVTKENIIEYNKIIAEFMGAKPCKDWQGYDGYEHKDWHHLQWSNRFQDNLELNSYRYSDLWYHSDWNWLMSVVKKVEDTKDSQGYSTIVEIWKNGCRIVFGNDTQSFDYILAKTKIEAVWLSVVEFIKWYNVQKIKSKPS